MVSTNSLFPDKSDQLNSLEAQKEFFVEYTQRTGDILVRLYADEGISGTKIKNRREFLHMMADAERHLFDMVVVKDISRFARNKRHPILRRVPFTAVCLLMGFRIRPDSFPYRCLDFSCIYLHEDLQYVVGGLCRCVWIVESVIQFSFFHSGAATSLPFALSQSMC